MNGHLILQSTGEGFALEPTSILGRSSDSTVQVPDAMVSRRHAMIREHPDGFWYFDLGSFNGSMVNGLRVTAARKLTSGDRIEIGDHAYLFEQEGQAATSAEQFIDATTLAQVKNGETILLVSDIQGYTALSERLSPDQLAPIIGSWYSQTEEILSRHGAILDKFIGDCALAYWTDTSAQSRIRAFQTAGAMQQSSIDTYNAHRQLLDSVGLTFWTGTAIHLGRVAYGGFSAQEFTLIGDPVNLVFRMEALTRSLGHSVVTSADFLRDWPDGVRYCKHLGPQQVKGRTAPVDVYAVEQVPGGG